METHPVLGSGRSHSETNSGCEEGSPKIEKKRRYKMMTPSPPSSPSGQHMVDTKRGEEIWKVSRGQGTLYMADEESSGETKPRLFFPLGENVFIDKPSPNGNTFRIALWKNSESSGWQLVNNRRYKVLLNLGQLSLLRANLAPIEEALNGWKRKTFRGFRLHLGKNLYATVEMYEECRLSFRKWYCPKEEKGLAIPCLEPSNVGVYCEQDQFEELKVFLLDPLCDEIKSLNNFKHPCSKRGHDKDVCEICNPRTRLQMDKHYRQKSEGE